MRKRGDGSQKVFIIIANINIMSKVTIKGKQTYRKLLEVVSRLQLKKEKASYNR